MRLCSFLVVGGLCLACSGGASPRNPAQARTPERRPEPAQRPAEPTTARGPRASDDLEWDSAVGWEPRYRWAPGEISRTRPEGSTIVLEYVLDAGFFPAIAARSAGLPLRDKPLIVRRTAELCHAALHQTVAEIHPDRLLLEIDGDLGETERDCLARLPVHDLFVSTCRRDGAMPLVDSCTDGDRQLATIASSPALRDKIRGLAIGFGGAGSWRLLPQFRRLSHLAIRGPALERIDLHATYELCQLPDLDHVDALIADHPGAELSLLVPSCVMRWSTFRAWTIPGPDAFTGRSLPARLRPSSCRLRLVTVWRIDGDLRQRLETDCPGLEELEIVETQERCDRPDGHQPLRCRPVAGGGPDGAR